MAYVFGIEGIPVFEMLLIILALLLMGLIFILLELRKLTKLLGEEKVDLRRFELDLADFEKDQGKKPTSQLVSYIEEAISKGMGEPQIEALLMKRGWSKKQVDSIFESLKR